MRSRSLHRRIVLLVLLTLALTGFIVMPCIAQQLVPKDAPYLNPKLSIDQRVDDLVSRMTLDEKASQVVHRSRAIERLGIPAYNWWSEALHGVVSDNVTIFPEPIGLAATFDAALIREMGTVIGTEARAKHHEHVRMGKYFGIGLDFWAPNVNIFRDPRWGRGQETYGEDPFLSGRMAVAFVVGMQGDDSKYYRVIATPKHFAVHSGPEPLRHSFDAKVSKHDELDTYLPAFRAAVTEGKAGSIMCVYNSVNGQPGCASEFLLQDQLREKWGFKGYVVSDCDAVYDIYRGHNYTKTLAEAGGLSLKRGTDLDCNDPGNDYSRYVDAVKQGVISEDDLDVAVKRLFRARFALGMFDAPETVKYAQTPFAETDAPSHRVLAAKIARESMVLLKNDGVLPLRKSIKKIAVVGPMADSTRVMRGNYNGTNLRIASALGGIRKQFADAEVTFVPGTNFLRDSQTPAPASWFVTEDGKPGVKGEYFMGTKLAGSPVVTRIDKSVDFDFMGASPAPGLEGQNFSVRWTGYLVPSESGTFKLGAAADDGYRLWLDEKLIAEDWGAHEVTVKTSEVNLEKGKRYRFKMDYFQGAGNSAARIVAARSVSEKGRVSEAVELAKASDVVIAVVGINSDLEGEEMPVDVPGFNGGDRVSIDLPRPEEDLLKALGKSGKPLVVVLTNGSALAVNWADRNANAILDAWYAGEEGGNAIAETLAGINNPAGRLPVTFYTGVQQLPPFEDYSMKGRTYRYFEGKPLYPFGYGLSYSKFAYSGLKLSSTRLKAGEPLTLEGTVSNIGERKGDEVVQVYLSFPEVAGAPRKALRAFARVNLEPGASKKVSFTLAERDLSLVSEAGEILVAAGNYTVSVGGGQPGFGAPGMEASFVVEGSKKLPE